MQQKPCTESVRKQKTKIQDISDTKKRNIQCPNVYAIAILNRLTQLGVLTMPRTPPSIHDIDAFFFSPSQMIKNKQLSSKDKKIGFLTSGALLDSRVCKVLDEIIQIPKPSLEIPAEIIHNMQKNFWNPIRAWREYLYLSSEYMAKKLNIDINDYLDIESQPSKINDDVLEKISANFGVHSNLLIKSIEKYNQSCVLLRGME